MWFFKQKFEKVIFFKKNSPTGKNQPKEKAAVMRGPLVKRKHSYSSPFVIIEVGSESEEGTSLEEISEYFTMRKACCQSAQL